MVRPSGQIRLDIFTRGVFPTASLILLRGGPYPSPRALANSRDGVVVVVLVVVVDTAVPGPRFALPPPTEKAETKNLRRILVELQHTKAPYMVTRFNLENFIWILRNEMIEREDCGISVDVLAGVVAGGKVMLGCECTSGIFFWSSRRMGR